MRQRIDEISKKRAEKYYFASHYDMTRRIQNQTSDDPHFERKLKNRQAGADTAEGKAWPKMKINTLYDKKPVKKVKVLATEGVLSKIKKFVTAKSRGMAAHERMGAIAGKHHMSYWNSKSQIRSAEKTQGRNAVDYMKTGSKHAKSEVDRSEKFINYHKGIVKDAETRIDRINKRRDQINKLTGLKEKYINTAGDEATKNRRNKKRAILAKKAQVVAEGIISKIKTIKPMKIGTKNSAMDSLKYRQKMQTQQLKNRQAQERTQAKINNTRKLQQTKGR